MVRNPVLTVVFGLVGCLAPVGCGQHQSTVAEDCLAVQTVVPWEAEPTPGGLVNVDVAERRSVAVSVRDDELKTAANAIADIAEEFHESAGQANTVGFFTGPLLAHWNAIKGVCSA